MRACPFCNYKEYRTVEVQDSWTGEKNYRIVCEVCDSMGPTAQNPEMAEKKWEGLLLRIDPVKHPKYFDQILKEEKFERGRNPKRAMNLGLCQKIFGKCGKNHSEGGGYSFDAYGPENWMDIISWLLDQGYNEEEVESVMRSKLMRWAADRNEGAYGTANLEHFLNFNNDLYRGKTQVDSFLDEFFPDPKRKGSLMRANKVQEDAMGGVSGPMSTLNNTPGMGNATPAQTATTGSMGTSNAGSGDQWDSSTGKIKIQESKYVKYEGKPYEILREDPDRIFIKSLKNPYGGSSSSSPMIIYPFWVQKDDENLELNEQNINPHDKLGVAMAKKMGIDIPFEKGKGDQDVRQKEIDEDIDLSTKLMTFEEWAKKFLNQ